MQTTWSDTIVALATPPGIGAIGVIRLSGPKAFSIANAIFPAKDLEDLPSHTIHVGMLQHENKILDEAVISLFKGPRSYTGEDVVEISCHGSPYIHAEVINACVHHGARLAKPGEFTQRAFLNGKMDLAQAEAVADLIASNTAASQKAALYTMRGGFSEDLRNLRERLLRFSALIELELDFSQEDVEFADRKEFYHLLDELSSRTKLLLDSFALGNVVRNGVSVAIVGKPNVGKSTLLNSLLKENRAIVSDIPGTTRDTIEEVINIDGILFRLIDTAGIREHTTDTIESQGIERSMTKMKEADLVLYVFDVNTEPIQEYEKMIGGLMHEQIRYILVGNKIDLAKSTTTASFSVDPNVVHISAKDDKFIDQLRHQMVETVLRGQVQTESTVVTNARHYHALKEVEKSLSEIRKGLDDRIAGDLLALDIRRCLHYLGEITGEITNDEQLGYIFGKFCIGK